MKGGSSDETKRFRVHEAKPAHWEYHHIYRFDSDEHHMAVSVFWTDHAEFPVFYPQFQVMCIGTKDTDGPNAAVIQGENGWMRMDGKPNVDNDLEVAVVGSSAEGAGQSLYQCSSGGTLPVSSSMTCLVVTGSGPG